MKNFCIIAMGLSFLFVGGIVGAQVPQIINYQGRVSVNGINFDGKGHFQFALVDGTGGTTYWSNGTGTVSVGVSMGLYSVLLGDTTQNNMAAIPGTVFTNSDVRLRVWFDGGEGLQQLIPDQRLTAVGYAMMAGNVPDGVITGNKLAVGAVQSANIAVGAVGATQIAGGAVGSAQLASNLNLSAGSISLGGVTQTNWPIGFRAGVVLTNGVLDTSLSQYYTIRLTNNIAWNFQRHALGNIFWLKVSQDTNGGWANAWDPNVVWPNGVPSQGIDVANRSSLFQFVDDGTLWFGSVVGSSYPNNTNVNFALQFDGTQNYVLVANSSVFNAPATIEFWFKSTSTVPHWFMGNRFSGDGGRWGIICYPGTSIQFASIADAPDIATGNWTDGQWHHFAVTISGGISKIYADGTLRDTETFTTGNTGNNLTIGEQANDFTACTMDEIRYSSVVRYTGTFTPAPSFTLDANTVAYWKFNSGTGTIAYDETGSHNGSLVGNPLPTWVPGR
jgi:hypothetical protein